MTGRITQRGDNLSIGVELIDVADRTQMWGEQYHRKATDLLKVQTEISGEIAEKLHRRLTADERDRLEKQETTNQQAYELALRGASTSTKAEPRIIKSRSNITRRALAVDPEYALAYVGLSNRRTSISSSTVSAIRKSSCRRSKRQCGRPSSSTILLPKRTTRSGISCDVSWDWPGAERAYRRAIR